MLPKPFKYFTYKEALRFCTKNEVAECVNRGYISNLFYMLYHLDHIRELFGDIIFVNSSYRNEEHNARVKGSTTSQHLTASALDIRPVHNRDLKKLVNIIIDYGQKHDCFGQVFVYKHFVHIGAKDMDIPSCSSLRIAYM